MGLGVLPDQDHQIKADRGDCRCYESDNCSVDAPEHGELFVVIDWIKGRD